MTPEEYREKEVELFKQHNIPEELRNALSYISYEQSHAYGYDEILNTLTDMTYNLSKPIQKLIERITKKEQR